MKTIKIGTGDAELPSEERPFCSDTKNIRKQNRDTLYLFAHAWMMHTVDAKLAEIPKVDYDRIGERMYVELVYVNCDAEGQMLPNTQHL